MNTNTLYDGHGWRLTLESAPLPDGRVKTMARARRCDTVHIIAQPKPGTVLLIKEFRPHFAEHIWMLPSGKIDKEADPLRAAQRELQEETGFRAKNLKQYCTCHHAEVLAWTSHIFLASDLVPDPLPQDATEMITTQEFLLDDAITKVLSCAHVHTTSAYALLRFAREQKAA